MKYKGVRINDKKTTSLIIKMIQFNSYNVIMLLYATFTAFNLPQSPITSEEVEMKENIERMLQEMQNKKEFQLEVEETLDFYNAYEVPEAEKADLFEEDDTTHNH